MGIHYVLDELDDHLGVGLALEMIAQLQEFLLEREIVLDDAVVDKGQVTVLRIMGMGVHIAGFAVGGPSCVGYSGASADVFVLADSFKVADFAFGLIDHEVAAFVYQRYTGAVIASVLKSFEAFDQNGIGLP